MSIQEDLNEGTDEVDKKVESIIKVSEVEIEPEIEKDMYEEKPKGGLA